MPTSIELVKFDPYSTSIVELGPADEIIGLDSRIYNKEHQPYLIVRRETPAHMQFDMRIWKIAVLKLSEATEPTELSITPKGKLFTFQRISESGARTGNYDSYLAYLVVADCSGKREPVTIWVTPNGESGNQVLEPGAYFSTFGKMDKLFNLFVVRSSGN